MPIVTAFPVRTSLQLICDQPDCEATLDHPGGEMFIDILESIGQTTRWEILLAASGSLVNCPDHTGQPFAASGFGAVRFPRYV